MTDQTQPDNLSNLPPLPTELLELTEQMARRVHDEWMQRRIEQGWRFGPERNDSLKTHPCLVDYVRLPESEKEYDRATARATLRFILSQGFTIAKTKA